MNYNRNLFLPPGTPDDILRVYWNAAEAMTKDPKFYDDPLVEQDGRWAVAEAGDKEFKLNYGVDPKVSDWLKATLFKYGVS